MKRGCYWMVGRDTPHQRVVVEVFVNEDNHPPSEDYRSFPTVGTAEVWAKARGIDLVWDQDSTEAFAND